MIWFTHWVPWRRSDNQAKNNEESILEWLVQATKKKKEKEQTDAKRTEKKDKGRNCIMLNRKKKKKRKTATERKKRNCKYIAHPKYLYLSVN